MFDAVIDEVVRPSEKMPLRHLAVEKLADHLFQLGKCLSARVPHNTSSQLCLMTKSMSHCFAVPLKLADTPMFSSNLC